MQVTPGSGRCSADSKINHFFPLAQWMRIGGLGGDWGFAVWGFALWSSSCCSFSSSLVFGQIEPTASRPGLATFFTFILIKLSAKLAEIPDPGSGQVIPSLGSLAKGP